jgi:hypothetical protein
MTQTSYSRELADAICRRMSEGESLRAVCRDAGMPSEGTIRGWEREDRDGFAEHYRQARLLQLDYWGDEIIKSGQSRSARPASPNRHPQMVDVEAGTAPPWRSSASRGRSRSADGSREVDLGRLSMAEFKALEQFASALIEATGS